MKTKECPVYLKQIPMKLFREHRNSHIADLGPIADAIRNYRKNKYE